MATTRKKMPARGSASRASSNGVPPPEPDRKRALDLVMALMAIPGKSCEEAAVAAYVRNQLERAGASASAIKSDQAHRKTPHGGQVGNLVFQLPGTTRGRRRMLMAHLDTVPLCVGSKPVLKGGWVRSGADTALGADDRAGTAVVLNTAVEILRRDLPHPPLTFFWPVQEEIGLHGARFANLSMLGRPRLAFNWDGGPADKATIGATGAYRIRIDVEGLASHAGGAPEKGISAIAIAGLAIADLERNGWHGDIRKGRHIGTSNIGYISGGDATNVITSHVQLRAEARSHDAEFRRRILREIEGAFRRAARAVQNDEGRRGRVEIASQLDYDAFLLSKDEPCVLAAEAAIRSIGQEPLLAVANGGLDANWMSARGIPTVTLGCGQSMVHTTSECLDVAVYQSACRIALRLATESE